MSDEQYQSDKRSILALQVGYETCGEYTDGTWSVALTANGYEVTLSESTGEPMRPFHSQQTFATAHEAVGAIGAL